MNDLKTLALAATPGKWDSYETRVYLPSNAGGFDIRNSPNAENNAAYIAAASPAAILKLLAERDRLREALKELTDYTYKNSYCGGLKNTACRCSTDCPIAAVIGRARQALEAAP